MFAWQADRFGEPLDVLELKDIDKPIPGPGEVVIKVSAVGLGLPDLMSLQGRYPFVTECPAVPGHSFSGTVDSTAPDSAFVPGQRVMARTMYKNQAGALAEYAVAQEIDTFPVPDALDDEQAAGFVVPYHTAYVGLVSRAKLAEGETLLVLGGAGASGSAAIELGKALGAHVVATARGEAKADFCRKLGADHVIDATQCHIGEAVREVTDGHGADVIFDPVGGEPSDAAVHGIAFGGRLILIGISAGFPTLSPIDMINRTYSVMGAALPNRTADERSQAIADLDALVTSGKISVPIEGRYSFDETPGVIARLGGEIMGRHIIKVP